MSRGFELVDFVCVYLHGGIFADVEGRLKEEAGEGPDFAHGGGDRERFSGLGCPRGEDRSVGTLGLFG